MRERLATLDIDDADIVGVAVAPIMKSSPPPLVRRSSAPPAPRAASVPPPPASQVAPRSRVPVPTTAKLETPAQAFALPPPPVTAFDLVEVEAEVCVAPPPPPAFVAPVAPVAPAAGPGVVAARPPAASVLRLSVNDPTDLVFDGMYGLSFARSTSEAAEMIAETLAKAFGARTVVVHTHDLMSRELRAIAAHGDGDFDIIGSAEASDDDLVASAVICNQKAVTMKFDGELSRLAPKRLHTLGAPRTLVAVPVMSWGRCLAVIEVIDADERFAGRVADALAYVAQQFAQFLSARAA